MRKILLLLISGFLSTLYGNAQSPKSEKLVISSSILDKEKFMEVSDFSWLFKAGDEMQWAQSKFDDSNWNSRRSYWFADSLKGKDNFKGIGWMRLKFKVDDSLLNKILYLQICQPGACEVYLDGNLIGNLGEPSTDPKKEKILPTLFEAKNVYLVHTKKINLKLAIPLLINSQKVTML
jgi:two-component system, NtrC family, sensor kinase